jgi:carbamate kinase
VEAVVDKDDASALLANELAADLFAISTGVPQVAVRYNQPDQRWLSRVTAAEARVLVTEGHFAAGSMGPKVRAMLDFLARGGLRGVITDPPNLYRAVAGEAGTHFVHDAAG